MDIEPIEIVPLERRHIDGAAELLAKAFREEPGAVAIIRGTPEKRLRILRGHYATQGEMNLSQGVSRVALLGGKIAGVMHISAPGKEIVGAFDMIRVLWRSVFHVSPAVIWRGLKGSLDDENHRPKEPNYCLETIGVDPELQGHGIGSRMLAYLTELADGEGVLTYLSTTDPRTLPLYKRFGFRIISETDQSGVPNYHLVRKPNER